MIFVARKKIMFKPKCWCNYKKQYFAKKISMNGIYLVYMTSKSMRLNNIYWQVSAQLLQQYYTHPEPPQQDFDIFSRRFFVTSTIVSCCHHWFGSNAEDHWLLSGQRWSFFQGNFFIFPLSSSSYHLTFKSCCCCCLVGWCWY